MSDRLPFGLDPALIDSEFDSSVSEPVTAQEIYDYAESLGEKHPAFFAAEPVAPPTFCVKFRGNRFFHPSMPHDALLRGFDAGKDIQFGAAIRAGDVIRTRNVLHELYEKTGRSGSMVFIVTRQTMTNQRDEMVAVIDNRFMVRPKGKK